MNWREWGITMSRLTDLESQLAYAEQALRAATAAWQLSPQNDTLHFRMTLAQADAQNVQNQIDNVWHEKARLGLVLQRLTTNLDVAKQNLEAARGMHRTDVEEYVGAVALAQSAVDAVKARIVDLVGVDLAGL